MKKKYREPLLWWIPVSDDDVLTMSSGDNDVPFVSGGDDHLIDQGWGKYY